MTGFVDELVELASSVSLETLPGSVVREARRTLVDTVGVILGGMAAPPALELAKGMAAASVAPCSTMLGSGLQADPLWAALANGTAGVWHDYDAGNRFLGGHPAIHSLAAGLAVAEQEGASGRRFFEVFIAAYEAAARVGLGISMRPEMHPHGTWAVVGSATAAALLSGSTPALLREAINVSTSLTLATSWQTAYQGATVRNVYAGFGAAMGVLSAEMVKAGFTGEGEGIATVFGGLSGLSFDPAKAREGLGERWMVERGYQKLYASARHLHSALDALILLDREEPIPPDEVERIDVRTFAMAASMNAPLPESALAAKFSAPFVLAAYLRLHETGISAFTEDKVREPGILALAARVEVREDVEMEARTPAERAASVRVELRGGRARESHVTLPRGDFGSLPCGDEELDRKFLGLAELALGAAGAARALEMLREVEKVPDIRQITAAARGGER